MKNKKLLFYLPIALLFSYLLVSSCKRINSFTDLGGGLIPAVDNINTFDTTLDVLAYNHILQDNEDSLTISSSDYQLLGNIENDPFFGKRSAKIYLQLKPSYYPYSFARKDSLQIDSVVLVMDYTGTYGDTNTVQTINAYEITDEFRADSAYLARQSTFTTGQMLGTANIVPADLKDSVKAYMDTTAYQMRIRLDNSFGQRLLDYDSTSSGAYHSDSLFNTFFKGFAIEAAPGTGNALMAFDITNTAGTKLAIYYRYPKDGQEDTTVNYFTFSDYYSFTGSSCAHHNYISKDFSGTPLEAAAATPGEDDYIYLVNVPGSYATVKIPGLSSVTNRLVHRAELVVDEVYDPSDETFLPPTVLWMDAYDSSISSYRIVPYDVYLDGNGSLNFSSFGALGNVVPDGSGHDITRWSFDLTRYVQKIVTEHQKVMDFRLIVHRALTDSIYSNNYSNSGTLTPYRFGLNATIGTGRVRVAGGNALLPQRMRLHIIYSKI